MFDQLIAYSIRNKLVVGLLVGALIMWGLYSLQQLPIDAVPDITNNQVQVITSSPSLATQEVEQFITTPIELALQNMQRLVEIRSISRFGLSVITVVFEEDLDIYLARQLVNEHLEEAIEDIPDHLGKPVLSPISTGLGEIYQYIIRPKKGYERKYTTTKLRSIQDWIVKRQLSGIPGVVEINTLGGHLKQYEVAVNPNLLKSVNVTIGDIFSALENSNENAGGAYIEKNPNTYYIRTEGLARSLQDVENIVVTVRGNRAILVKDVATVQFGKAPRYGAVTSNGREVVGGMAMMLKGENSAAVTERIKERMEQVQKSLPEGVVVEPYLVRDKLITTAIGTVRTNLLEGGLIVVFILVLLLGNWRAGLIVASVIPLAMLFAVSMMNVLGISANLMSLGAIDFGLIVDGAVIMVEAIIHRLQTQHGGKKLTRLEMNNAVTGAAQQIRNSAAFGEIIILMVYIPILALAGIEGKMFKPMAQTVMLAIGGALVLSLTYVPMMTALFLNKNIINKTTLADRIIGFCQKVYHPILHLALKFKIFFVMATLLLFIYSMIVFRQMGSEFIPTLEEGDLALHQILPPGSSLTQSVETSKIIQKKLLAEFPEIEKVVTKIGSAEVPTDPMPVETGDIMVIMKPKSEWTSAATRTDLYEKMEASLSSIPGVAYEFSQPIQMRFNELMTGSRADIAIKLYGQDLNLLYEKGQEAENIIRAIPGVGSTNLEQTVGMPQIMIKYNYDKMAKYGLHVKELNTTVRTAFAGEKAGVIYEGDRRFDLVVRLDEAYRKDIGDVSDLFITLENGIQIPLSTVAEVKLVDAPMQISRDNTNRRIVIGANVGNIDVATLVKQIQDQLEEKVVLPPGYYFTYGGQFENLQAANARLAVAVPLALLLIFILLYFTFGSLSQAALIFTAIPLSAIGGIWSLTLRGMPFSISAGIGFIALFGVAVLNGIVLIGYFNQLKKEGMSDIKQRILTGTEVRLRPVLMTAAVASLGFLPMALSNSGGAEVQRPLATVVIGGLLSATFLTLVILPILYYWLSKWQERKSSSNHLINLKSIVIPFLLLSTTMMAQQTVTLDEAIELALQNHPAIRTADLQISQSKSLENLPYTLGTTDFFYQGNGLFSKNNQRINQLGVVQNIPHPATVKALNAQQKQYSNRHVLDRALTENELHRMVAQVYLAIQSEKQLAIYYQEISNTYRAFFQIAETRVRLGHANKLEMLAIQVKLEEYQMLLEQTTLKIGSLEGQLSGITMAKQALTTADSLTIMDLPTAATNNPLVLRQAEQDILLAQTEASLLTAQVKPNFLVGYALENYFEGGWLHGLQAGIQLPLFKKQTKLKISAMEGQVSVAQSALGLARQHQTLTTDRLKNDLKVYQNGISFYKKQLTTIRPEMLRVAKLNYRAGTLSYLELLNTISLQANYQEQLVRQINAYNNLIIEYKFNMF